MSAYDDELEAAYVRAIWERNAAVHAAETRSFEAYKARMIECELREALAFESAFRVVLYFAVAVTLVALFTALPVHAWVVLVRESSGQRVDWHYSGGIAQVLFIGDRDKVRDAIRLHESAFGGEWVKVIAEGEPGLYRAGVTVID